MLTDTYRKVFRREEDLDGLSALHCRHDAAGLETGGIKKIIYHNKICGIYVISCYQTCTTGKYSTVFDSGD